MEVVYKYPDTQTEHKIMVAKDFSPRFIHVIHKEQFSIVIFQKWKK